LEKENCLMLPESGTIKTDSFFFIPKERYSVRFQLCLRAPPKVRGTYPDTTFLSSFFPHFLLTNYVPTR
jgi:hypothetical protein